MKSKRIRYVTAIVLPVLTIITAVSYPAGANDRFGVQVLGIAIEGYDPVAYFTEGKALRGSETFTHFWNDAEWRFINAAHRDLFAANPKRYAPRHGGF